MRQLSCPVCFTVPLRSPSAGTRLRCSSCQVGWTFLPDEVDAPALYRDAVYAVVDNRKSIFEKIIFSEARAVLRQAKKIHPHAKRLLDFGAGKGQFLAVAKALGWEGTGIETEVDRVYFASEKYKVNVRQAFYEKGKLDEQPYDLVSLNHVLEHLPQPLVLLQELLAHNLGKDGLLYLEVPRANSWQAQLAGDEWMHWDIPKHLSHWTEEDLMAQLRALGFSPAGSRPFSLHLGVLGMLQALVSNLGYRENLVWRLKNKKTPGLLVLLALFFPLAWGLERLSATVGKSGICGLYFKKHD